MALPRVVYYYEDADAPEEEKEEIRGLLKKLPSEVKVNYETTVEISALQFRGERESYEGRDSIVKKLNELHEELKKSKN